VRDELTLSRIISVACAGVPFIPEDIWLHYKDVDGSEVEYLIDKLVDKNILSDNGARRYVFHSNLEKSYFRENSK
jgi:predicted transcriptional regulator